ncbi:MAG TPA: TylF/MycF/NovP-related O-methyltransferase [Nevskiaceae bacterium]|nr:TylF/MycF/NovP-related O-methyltransferase [Nevskiaceae bacterium]
MRTPDAPDWSGLPEIFRRVAEQNLTYLKPRKLRSLLDALARVKSAGVAGDFVEFGVALGGSAICIASQLDGTRRFAGYDVFGMIPPPTDKDGAKPNARYETIRSGQSQGIGGATYYGYVEDLLAVVKANFAAFDLPVDDRRIRLVRGRYEESLAGEPPAAVAFAHVDCDWYESVRTCLDHLRANLSPGGVAVFDDYNDWEGCRLAVDEFVAAEPGFTVLRLQPHAVLMRN